jgi:hypothetical protein
MCGEAEEAVLDLKHSLQSLSKHTMRLLPHLEWQCYWFLLYQQGVGCGRGGIAVSEALAADAVQSTPASFCYVSHRIDAG